MSTQTAGTAAAQPKRPKKRSKPTGIRRFGQLFFIKRFPKFFGGDPEDWSQPEDDAEYQKYIDQQGFVSPVHWKEDDLTQHPVVMQDLKDLEQHMLPTFFSFGQKARHYQNQFYVYQWVFIIGAFLTTLFGTLALFSYRIAGTSPLVAADVIQSSAVDLGSSEADSQTEADSQAAANAQTVATGLSYLTAIVGAVTAFTTTLSNRGEPRKRWSKARRLTEEMRAHYFRYLAHLPPYNTPDRVQRLREMVVSMQIKEQENV